MKSLLFGFILVANVCWLLASPPVVKNVRFEQRTDGTLRVDIYYDVIQAEQKPVDVSIQASNDHGVSWSLPCTHLTGDVGLNIAPGSDKHVVWDFHADNPGVDGQGYRIRVMADTDVLIDTDGNRYRTVVIGDQTWSAENLRATHYRNGDPLSKPTDAEEWNETRLGAYCAYDQQENLADIYGYLYNWYAVNDARDLAPLGWRVATDADWQILESHLGMPADEIATRGWRGTDQGDQLKETGTAHWQAPNAGATNSSGFTALPGGWHRGDISLGLTREALFWCDSPTSATGAWGRVLDYLRPQIDRVNYSQSYGGSVRLVQEVGEPAVAEALLITPIDPVLPLADTLFFTCTLQLSDGRNKTATPIAEWSLSPGIAGSIDSQGRLIADANRGGIETVTAVYDGMTASTTVMVQSPIETGTVTDIDGNTYRTVRIGDQWWSAENLRTTHYRNGDPIPNITHPVEWATAHIGAFCAYDNLPENLDTYGLLYNWFAVDDVRDLAPEGWRVASHDDWAALERYIGLDPADVNRTGWRGTTQGNDLRQADTTHWQSPNRGATDLYGFNALGAGYRIGILFQQLKTETRFWTSTIYSPMIFEGGAVARGLRYDSSGVALSYTNKPMGASVRLVQDDNPPGDLISLEIEPVEPAVAASQTVEFGCLAHFSNGQTKNATAAVHWSLSPGIAGSIDSLGRFTADAARKGRETVTATYRELTASTTITVETPIETGTLVDIDGNIYPTVRIGSQWWSVENLKTTHYRNGDPIPNITDANAWATAVIGACCAYDNLPAHVDNYGLLYNWYAVDDVRNVAPEGWRVASHEDWKALESCIGLDSTDLERMGWRGSTQGNDLRDSGTDYWQAPNAGATDRYGFNARGAGYRMGNFFYRLKTEARFWTSTPYTPVLVLGAAKARMLRNDQSQVSLQHYDKPIGASIRLVKDDGPPANLISLEIKPADKTVAAGEILQLGCVAHFLNGQSKNATAAAQWSLVPGIAGTIDSLGRFTADAVRKGTEKVIVTYEGRFASTRVMVETPIETGTVTDIDGN
ncbi:fibrobacter succinogenes major paralogous domain-containing protein, partial [candidate division KSB1 bacterium]|nr:fibrobacter succinogenes major paralogous domain-containing protein [candidate division KSB1 bacterium]